MHELWLAAENEWLRAVRELLTEIVDECLELDGKKELAIPVSLRWKIVTARDALGM